MVKRYYVSLGMERVQVSKQYVNGLHLPKFLTIHNEKNFTHSFLDEKENTTFSNTTVRELEEKLTTQFVQTTKQERGIQNNGITISFIERIGYFTIISFIDYD